ncbi:Cation/H(+) antiporter 11 [Euphorbia peplus]|nr:Cation/H(+) antiporter 11 [Euphorbia peplus]
MNSTIFICWNVTNVASPGLLIGETSPLTQFLSYSMPRLELQLGIILMMSHGLSFLFGRFGISVFICQIITGIILGPSILGRFDFMKQVVFPMKSSEVLIEAAVFGFLIHFFLVAVHINLDSAKRLTGKFAILTGIASVFVPLAAGLAMFFPYFHYIDQRGLTSEALAVILLQSCSAFSVVVHVLKELKIPSSEIALLLLSSALISGVISIQIMVVNTISFTGKDFWWVNASAYYGFVIFIAFVIRPGMNWMIARIPAGSPLDSSITCTLMLMGLMSEIYCQMFNQTPGIGVYTLGIFIPAGRPLGSTLIEKFESFNYSVLLPVSVVISTMKADFSLIFTDSGEIRIYVMFVIVIGVVKMISCLIPMVCCHIPFVDSVLFATIMASRGTIEMAVCLICHHVKLISDRVYALLVFNILVTSLIVAMIVKRLYIPTKNYTGYRDRSVSSLKSDSQLRMLVCVHNTDNMYSVTRFLDAFRPTRERFLFLHVLHLIPLTGLNTPMIISHSKKNPKSEDSVSHSSIVHFNQYEQKNSGGTSVCTYTSISPILTMNDDISILAFDHVASLIILPFHRKWSIHGRVEDDDVNIRTINRKVLEKAPCSVAILFDRGKFGRWILESQVSICVIFLGGEDDWEALALAKKTAENTSSWLTIIHFMLKNEVEDVEVAREDTNDKDGDGDGDQDDLNAKALENMLKTYEQNQTYLKNIEYVTKFVNGGDEFAQAIHSVADKYDLFVVGRRYGMESPKTAGLSEWIEIPELGIVGDILACKDVNTRAAVLVVQKQIQFS